MTREELAWAAGLFDGEGYVGVYRQKPKADGTTRGPARGQILVNQVDRRVLDRFQRAVGVGTVFGPYLRVQERHQPYYMFRARGYENVQAVIAMLWAFLSPVKRDQAREVIKVLRVIAPWTGNHPACRRGHPFTDDNVYRFTTGDGINRRLCKTCMKERNKTNPVRLARSKKRVASMMLEAI